MRKHIFIAFFCTSFLGYKAFAQNEQYAYLKNDSTLKEANEKLPKYVSISLSSFLEYYASFNLGVQKKINKAEYLSLEVGYIYNINPEFYSFWRQVESEPINDVQGFKLLFDYRYDLKVDEGTSKENTFLSLSPYFYFANNRSELVAGYECDSQFGRCTYYRLFQVNNKRIVPGFYFNYGIEYDYDYVKMAISLGLGLRYVANFNNVPNEPVVDRIYLKRGELTEIPEGFYANFKISYTLYFKYR